MTLQFEVLPARDWIFSHGKFDYKTDSVVPQPPQKGPNCWFYALKILRNQDELSNPPSGAEKAKRREFQAVSSKRRKDQTRAQEKFLENGALVRQLKIDANYTKHKLWTKAGAAAMLPRLEALRQSPSPVAQAEAESLCALLQPFATQDQCDDLSEFIQHRYYKTRSIIHDLFCRRFGIDCRKVIGEDKWNSWDLEHQTKYLETIAFRETFIRMGFKRAGWNPKDSPDVLMKEIQGRGFLYVKGFFGKSIYVPPPFELSEKFQGQPVYGWRPGDERRPNQPMHSIVLIGMKINSEQPQSSIVYFVDPLDGSPQKIYAMSYRKMTQEIADLVNSRYVDGMGQVYHSDAFGYALFNPALVGDYEPSLPLGQELMGDFVFKPYQEEKGD